MKTERLVQSTKRGVEVTSAASQALVKGSGNDLSRQLHRIHPLAETAKDGGSMCSSRVPLPDAVCSSRAPLPDATRLQ